MEISNRIYHLSTCSTCARILSQIGDLDRFELIDIKKENISPEVLDYVKDQMGDYLSFFSKRAMKYRSMGLNERTLTEEEYRSYILEEYTFLKRPVIIFNGKAFVGNSPKNIQNALNLINESN